MKNLPFLILLTFTLILNGQKVFLDKYKASIVDSADASFFVVTEFQNDIKGFKKVTFHITGEKESEIGLASSSGQDAISYLWYRGNPSLKFEREGNSMTWYKNGQLKSQNSFSNGKSAGKSLSWYENGKQESEHNYAGGKYEGKSSKWYDNGQLKCETEYSNGELNGILTTYWKNGQIKRKDLYNNGKLSGGTCYDSLGIEMKHFDLEVMPKYKGGDRSLINDISNNTRYPTNSRNSGIQGRVILRFAVDQNGNITEQEVIQGINKELNEEALRVLGTLKKFTPGRYDGQPVDVYYSLPITFSLGY
jgi:periplasmic protein TonB